MVETVNDPNGTTYRTVWRLWIGLVIVPALVAIVGGAWIIVDDLQTSGEFLDGLGIVLGLMIAAVAIFSLVMVATALWISARRPGYAVTVAGVWVALATFVVMSVLNAIGWSESLPYGAPVMLWVAGFIALSATAPRWPVAVAG